MNESKERLVGGGEGQTERSQVGGRGLYGFRAMVWMTGGLSLKVTGE